MIAQTEENAKKTVHAYAIKVLLDLIAVEVKFVILNKRNLP